MTSAGATAAKAAGVGQRAIHSRQTGSTRATGVCWSITSLTRTAHASTPGRRQGRSRAAVAYQSTIASPAAVSVAAAGGVLTGDQSAVPPARRAGVTRRDAAHYRSWRVAPGRRPARPRLLAPAAGGPDCSAGGPRRCAVAGRHAVRRRRGRRRGGIQLLLLGGGAGACPG